MHDAIRKLAALVSLKEISRLRELARDVSRSPRVYFILLLLVFEARSSAPDLDGRAAPMTRKALLNWLAIFKSAVSREALRKLLETLQVARMVELNGSHVRISRTVLDDLTALGTPAAGKSLMPSGAASQMPASSGATAQAPFPSGATDQAMPGASGAPSIQGGAIQSGQFPQDFSDISNWFHANWKF
jgi:hypothetical protein